MFELSAMSDMDVAFDGSNQHRHGQGRGSHGQRRNAWRRSIGTGGSHRPPAGACGRLAPGRSSSTSTAGARPGGGDRGRGRGGGGAALVGPASQPAAPLRERRPLDRQPLSGAAPPHRPLPGARVRANVDAGTITAEDLNSPSFEASSGAGNLSASFLRPPSSVEMTTNTGILDLAVPPASYAVDAGAGVGLSSIEIPDDPTAPRRLLARAAVGQVHISTR